MLARTHKGLDRDFLLSFWQDQFSSWSPQDHQECLWHEETYLDQHALEANLQGSLPLMRREAVVPTMRANNRLAVALEVTYAHVRFLLRAPQSAATVQLVGCRAFSALLLEIWLCQKKSEGSKYPSRILTVHGHSEPVGRFLAPHCLNAFGNVAHLVP